jgi:hypothetical protein
LGGGSSDNSCTGRSTAQVDVETAVIQAISPGGAAPMISSGGIDVLYCNHHGSESSTNRNWMNFSKPAVALISTGAGQSSNWNLPRRDVVEKVLLARVTTCITVPATDVFQTEEGNPVGSLTSFAGYCVGDIKVTSDGIGVFTVSADGAVNQGPNELAASGLPKTYLLDDIPVSVSQDAASTPQAFQLSQNSPNPFNPVTTIAYELPRDSWVRLEVFTMLGQQVALLVDRKEHAGYKQVRLDASELPSGIYFYRLQADGMFVATKKMVLQR